MAEHDLDEKVIGISFDGTGYGSDANIWGGEFLVADTEEYSRFSYFDYVKMPGGDKVVDEPWRMAYSYLYKYFGDSIDYQSIPVFRSVPADKLELVREMILNDINSPLTSSAGRLFDAVSSLLGICTDPLFDSEAPVRLESEIRQGTEEYYPFTSGETIDFSEMFKSILAEMRSTDRSLIAARFHNTVAMAVAKKSEEIRNITSIEKVVLSGGVFQNRYLLEKTIQNLKKKMFKIYTNHLVPSNDGGIALGQLIVASKKSGICA
jgi:hydrogenase maturation protein HypF